MKTSIIGILAMMMVLTIATGGWGQETVARTAIPAQTNHFSCSNIGALQGGGWRRISLAVAWRSFRGALLVRTDRTLEFGK